MSVEELERLATRFDEEIGGVYGYIAAALRDQAARRRELETGATRPRKGRWRETLTIN